MVPYLSLSFHALLHLHLYSFFIFHFGILNNGWRFFSLEGADWRHRRLIHELAVHHVDDEATEPRGKPQMGDTEFEQHAGGGLAADKRLTHNS
jgi:hypothetical protein